MNGTTLSHYRILSTLGEGGMGVVYLAEDQVLHRRVALKVLRPESLGDGQRRARFLQEARSAAALNHPHIATIYEANETDGTLFIAMELIDGRNLRTVLTEPISLASALDLGTQIADGLAHAHAHRVVHRDLKPENVMVTSDGRAKILDFGLAKLTTTSQDATMTMLAGQTQTAAAQLTVQGQIMGTPAYMSPEQARGQEVDFRSDVFSFGSMLYEMCTGKPSFFGPTALDTLSAVLHVVPPPVSHVTSRVPPALEDIVQRCLAKDPQQRYPSTDDLLGDLRRVDLSAKPRRRRRKIQGRKLALGAGVAIAIAAAAAAGLWLRPGGARAGHGPHYILVADFEGTSQTPGLADATRELVTAALAQSAVVTPLSRAQVQRGIRMAGRPDTTRVVGEVARELAYRASARVYVAGRVDQILSSYSIVLHVVDAGTRKPLHTVNGVAQSESELIDTLEKLSHELRAKLGEKRTNMQTTGKLREVITPSFEAFEIFVRAVEMQRQRQYKTSNQLLSQALALDPQFASAEKLRVLNYTNLGFADSARASYDAALRHPERLTESERLDLQFLDARVVRYDLLSALQISEALLKQPQKSTAFFNNRSTVQFNLGRYEEALATLDSAVAHSVFGASDLVLLNSFKTSMQLGLYDRGRALLDSLRGPNLGIGLLEYAASRSDWRVADSLIVVLQASDKSPDIRFQAEMAGAASAARHGAMGKAASAFEAAIQHAPNLFWTDVARMARVQLGICAGAPVRPDAPFLADTTMACTITRGIAAAAAGDTERLRQAHQNVHSRGEAEKRRYEVDLRLLDAWLASGSEDPAPLLEPMMGVGSGPAGPGPWFSGRTPLRWLVATAHERAGRTDAAIHAYEAVLSSQRLHHDAWVWWPSVLPFAHTRLAVLLAAAGRREEAATHARAVVEDLDQADTQGARLVVEARSVLAGVAPPP
jgi:tRNA A-37 threonylcarbamoyl transferase component Bud32/tetratricopeptide (TPR) repeat protein